MAVTCRNCGGTLVFDPEKQKMICDRCGSAITPGEVDFYAREILENKKPVPPQFLHVTAILSPPLSH